MLVNPSASFVVIQANANPEQHLDWKTIGCTIEIEEREAIHGFAKTQCSKYHSHPNQSMCASDHSAEVPQTISDRHGFARMPLLPV